MGDDHKQAFAALDIRNLAVEFRSGNQTLRAVDNVSLRLEKGRTLALVGESGSGKSVTSLAVMGLLAPGSSHCSGQIWFGGRETTLDLLTLDKKGMRKIRGDQMAMIFQEPMTSLNPMLTVGEQVAEAITLHRPCTKAQANAKALECITRVGIPDPGRRMAAYPHELSGGMRQRIMIAMALACDPTVVIADEPTTALDVTVQAQILDQIRTLQAELGTAVVFITHDLGVVAEVAHDVAVIYAGQIVETGTVDQVLTTPLHPYTKALLAAVPRPDRPRHGSLRAIGGMVPDLRNLPTGCRFHDRCEHRQSDCAREVPALELTEEAHWVRCWRWREQASRVEVTV